MRAAPAARRADPWRDTDVIDARAPRTNQAVVGVVSLVAVVTGWWPLFALLALQLGVGLTLGRPYCLPCQLYFRVIQPIVGEGPLEDSRPPRFANQVGFVVLSAASIAYAVGLPLVGLVLGTAVTSLALLAAATGLCVGCELYRIAVRLRAIGTNQLTRVDLADLGRADAALATAVAREFVVEFTHPLCSDCHTLQRRLTEEGRTVVTVDVRERRDLARKYGIRVVPTAVAVRPDGLVTARIAG